jgi:hypothetical protein
VDSLLPDARGAYIRDGVAWLTVTPFRVEASGRR